MITREERFCDECRYEVEDEIHFLLHCTKYNSERIKLMDDINKIVPKFSSLTSVEQFHNEKMNDQIEHHIY